MFLAIVRLMRPHQWIKNSFCLAGLVFSSQLTDPEAIATALETALCFCLASSTVYVFNDLVDRDRDRLHPTKRNRPIASGAVKPGQACALAVILAALTLIGSSQVHIGAFICVALYLLNNLLYSFLLKHQFLFDVLGIAVGFVLRLLGGTYAIGEQPTAWIVLCTLFLAFFLGFAKRRGELAALLESEEGLSRRPVLHHYSLDYLDQLLTNAGTMTIVCYAMFTASGDKNRTLVLTLPVVYYAIMRYTQRILVHGKGEEPEKLLIKDPHMIVSSILWLVLYLAIERSGIHLIN